MGLSLAFAALLAAAAEASRPVLTGAFEVGDRLTRLEAEPEFFDALPDAAGEEGYAFREMHVQILQPLRRGLSLSARYEQNERDYLAGFESVDHVVRAAAFTARAEPVEGVGVSLSYRVESKDFGADGVDNDVEALEWEVRWRRRPGESWSLGMATRGVEFDESRERDRTVARWRLATTQPVGDRLSLTARASAERFEYELPSPRRRPSIQRSASLSFRYEI